MSAYHPDPDTIAEGGRGGREPASTQKEQESLWVVTEFYFITSCFTLRERLSERMSKCVPLP